MHPPPPHLHLNRFQPTSADHPLTNPGVSHTPSSFSVAAYAASVMSRPGVTPPHAPKSRSPPGFLTLRPLNSSPRSIQTLRCGVRPRRRWIGVAPRPRFNRTPCCTSTPSSGIRLPPSGVAAARVRLRALAARRASPSPANPVPDVARVRLALRSLRPIVELAPRQQVPVFQHRLVVFQGRFSSGTTSSTAFMFTDFR